MTRTLDIAVIGAGPTGLTAALLLARDGHRVVVCETDGTDGEPDSTGRGRSGVSQFRMPHVVLPRWLHELADELPDLPAALAAAGANPYNLLHQQSRGSPRGGSAVTSSSTHWRSAVTCSNGC